MRFWEKQNKHKIQSEKLKIFWEKENKHCSNDS